MKTLKKIMRLKPPNVIVEGVVTHTLQKFKLKKVNFDTRVTPEDLLQQKKDDLIAEIKKTESKLEITKFPRNRTVHPEKPNKRKPHRRKLEEKDCIPLHVWASKVRECYPEDSELTFTMASEVDRYDVSDDNWRLVVMASYNAEFSITLYYDYESGFNTKKFSVEYVKEETLKAAINWVMESMKIFNEKE